MPKKRSKFHTFVIAVITVLAAGLFLMTLVRAVWYSPDTEIQLPDDVSLGELVPPGEYADRLQIPKLNIDANVQDVGINAQGNMANPNNFTDVGWYKYGTVPGRRGSAVMAGHVDNALSLDGVFKRLGDLETGDEVFVIRNDGQRLRFIVEEIEIYDYKNAPVEKIFEQDDARRLTLITCEGTWLRDEQSYDKRLVVYTRLAS